MKNFNDTIGNRSRGLPVCSTVPQPTAPPLTPSYSMLCPKISDYATFVNIATFCFRMYTKGGRFFQVSILLELLVNGSVVVAVVLLLLRLLLLLLLPFLC
jgi:hypothetical protein